MCLYKTTDLVNVMLCLYKTTDLVNDLVISLEAGKVPVMVTAYVGTPLAGHLHQAWDIDACTIEDVGTQIVTGVLLSLYIFLRV